MTIRIAVLPLLFTFLGLPALAAQTSPHAVGPCSLDRGTNAYLSEGETDRTLHPSAVGSLRVAVIFVDFPDAPATETAEALYASFLPGAAQWFDTASAGRFSLALQPAFRWFRMPLPSSAYGFDALTFQKHIAYVRDAVNVANDSVNFSGSDAIFVVSSRDAQIPVSPTLLGYPGTGVVADGTELRLGVTFGRDIRVSRANYGTHVAVHETLHILGLPDLYSFDGSPFPNFLRFAGGWDIMSWVAPGAHPLAWHSRKLGWIDESQIACISPMQTTVTTLTPLEIPGGVKAVAVRLSASRALVAEYRTARGLDASLCDTGLLVYTVDATVRTGFGPIVVQAAIPGADPAQLNRCGPLYAAPFDIGSGEVPAYTDPSGVRIELLSKDASGVQVRVSQPRPRRRSVRR